LTLLVMPGHASAASPAPPVRVFHQQESHRYGVIAAPPLKLSLPAIPPRSSLPAPPLSRFRCRLQKSPSNPPFHVHSLSISHTADIPAHHSWSLEKGVTVLKDTLPIRVGAEASKLSLNLTCLSNKMRSRSTDAPVDRCRLSRKFSSAKSCSTT